MNCEWLLLSVDLQLNSEDHIIYCTVFLLCRNILNLFSKWDIPNKYCKIGLKYTKWTTEQASKHWALQKTIKRLIIEPYCCQKGGAFKYNFKYGDMTRPCCLDHKNWALFGGPLLLGLLISLDSHIWQVNNVFLVPGNKGHMAPSDTQAQIDWMTKYQLKSQ